MIYRITFRLEEKTYQILANYVDTENHPYLIYVESLEFEDQSNLIISPNGNESRKRFGDVDKITIPVQSLQLIEELEGKEKIKKMEVIKGNVQSR